MHVLDVPDADPGRKTLRQLVAKKRVLVCVGSGGVGKTTTAASLGFVGASLGRRTLVITIDPARRLANALGLEELAHQPQRIDDAITRAMTVRGEVTQPGVKRGELFAMMLDVKAAWDDMLLRTAPSAEVADKILANRFYDSLSRDLPGAHEFIACECLHHLSMSGEWDLVVLDTPPTSNALDFLEAPSRILAVLDNEAFRFFAQKKQSLGLRFLDGAAGRAQSVLARFAGSEVLEELGEFIVLLRDLYEPLTDRTRAFEALLHGDESRFLVVTSPQPAALGEARFFMAELGRRSLPLGALILNRVTPSPGQALEYLASGGLESELESRGISGADATHLAVVLDEATRQQDRLATLDDEHISALVAGLGAVPVVRVPRLPDAVHDARRLGELMPWLTGPLWPAS